MSLGGRFASEWVEVGPERKKNSLSQDGTHRGEKRNSLAVGGEEEEEEVKKEGGGGGGSDALGGGLGGGKRRAEHSHLLAAAGGRCEFVERVGW